MKVSNKWVLFLLLLFFVPSCLFAQAEAPDDDYLFHEDSESEQAILEKRRENVLKPLPSVNEDIDFSAPVVSFDQEKNIITGKGGVIVSGKGYQAQGEEGQVQLDSKEVLLKKDVLLVGPESTIAAEEAAFNLESETGHFLDTEFSLEEGGYRVHADEAEKLNELDFRVSGCLLSTCHCEDGEAPWTISGSRANLEREGYAHVYNATFRMWEFPLLYTPWVAFPIKQERSSGLLVPEFGYSSRDGIRIKLPTYVVLDDSSDITLTPFTETKTRNGLQLDYREAFSERSSFDGRVVYSNESPRDGDLRGTDVTDIFEPEIDEDRVGGYIQQEWSNSPASEVPLSLVSDLHLVSDTLFLREMDDAEIGLPSSRYTTSRIAGRAAFSDYISSSLVGEWNQSITSPQENTFQRVPEFTVNALKSYRPFGFNPYGLKVTPRLQLQAVDFYREEGYDGLRVDLSPSVKIPFHYKNYFNSELLFEYHQTQYDLDSVVNPLDGSELDSSTDRGIWKLRYQAGTALERVYDLPAENLLATLTSLGSRNQGYELERVKHTLEPRVYFDYVPEEYQDDLPFFDSFDRMRKRKLVTYELLTRLLGSSGYREGGASDIEEFIDTPDTFTSLNTLSPLTDFDIGGLDTFALPGRVEGRGRRSIRELMSFRLLQSYDFVEEDEEFDSGRSSLSDLFAQFRLSPTNDFGMVASSNFDVEEQDASSWSLAAHLYDDRGDRIRARYTYIDESISQVEGNLEVPLTSRLRLGYYARFDDLEGDFIEQQAALRISSACDCWHVDVGYSDEINPDRERVLFRLTLKGLGDLTQDIGFEDLTRKGEE